MSLTQDILVVLRQSKGALTTNEIRDALGLERGTADAGSLSTRLKNLVEQGTVQRNDIDDRTTYQAISTVGAAPADAAAASAPKTEGAKAKPGPTPNQRAKAPKTAKNAKMKPVNNRRMPSAPPQAAPTRVPSASTVSIASSVILRLCALALSPDEPNAQERREIADLIKAAA
jgi:hypothetical protein